MKSQVYWSQNKKSALYMYVNIFLNLMKFHEIFKYQTKDAYYLKIYVFCEWWVEKNCLTEVQNSDSSCV